MANGGKRPGAGRKPGVPNKNTAEIKDMLRNALDGVGGQKYFQEQAKENPTAFMTLIGKIIPSDVNANISGKFTVSWEK